MREVNTHKIIRIFLASSIDDTKEERDKLQNKILAVWNPIFNKFNIHNQKSPYRWFPHSVHIHSTTIQNHSR